MVPFWGCWRSNIYSICVVNSLDNLWYQMSKYDTPHDILTRIFIMTFIFASIFSPVRTLENILFRASIALILCQLIQKWAKSIKRFPRNGQVNHHLHFRWPLSKRHFQKVPQPWLINFSGVTFRVVKSSTVSSYT